MLHCDIVTFLNCYIVTFLNSYIVRTMTVGQLPENFYFRVNSVNKETDTFWLSCKHRKTKGIMCNSKAMVGKIEFDGNM